MNGTCADSPFATSASLSSKLKVRNDSYIDCARCAKNGINWRRVRTVAPPAKRKTIAIERLLRIPNRNSSNLTSGRNTNADSPATISVITRPEKYEAIQKQIRMIAIRAATFTNGRLDCAELMDGGSIEQPSGRFRW